MPIGWLAKADLPEAIRLVKRVFMEFEAPEYSQEGVENFPFLEPGNLAAMLESGELSFYGYYADGGLAGMICMKGGNHICLLFVEKACHRRGIAAALFEEAKRHCPPGEETFTVHSSPYGVPVYSRWGFQADGPGQVQDGIRFTPTTCRGEADAAKEI